MAKTTNPPPFDPYALRRLVKPDFVHRCMENQTFYRVPGVIPAVDRLALIHALPKRLNEAMKAPFVDAVLFDVETLLNTSFDQSGQSMKDEVNKVAAQARKLLMAMAQMQPDALSIFEAFGLEVAYISRPPNQAFAPSQTPEKVALRQKIGRTADMTKTAFNGPAGSGVSKLWDVVQDIEFMAHVTAEHVAPKRGKTANESLNKLICRVAAHEYKVRFSKRPPLTETGWFALWLSDLGLRLGQPFSAKQAATALKRWQADQAPAVKLPG